MPLILASQSPRRKELLEAAGIPHQVRVVAVDESMLPGEEPVAYVRRLARAKALANEWTAGEIILTADTTVVCEGETLGKPAHADDARRMLRLLAGRKHEVITGVCLRQGHLLMVDHEATAVWFGKMTESDIDAYVEAGESMDKAGSYAIQGIASRYIERIEGSYSNVVGLPVALVWRKLEELKNSLS